MSAKPHPHGLREDADPRRGPMPPARPAERTEAAWSEFVAFLKARGARITQARRIVLAGALGRSDHFRADDLADELAGGPDRVSRGTVYRTLALLTAAGLVRQVRDADVHVHYESCFGRAHHEHLICDRCGRFIEFTDPALEQRLAAVGHAHHFRPRTHRVAIFGTCAACGGQG